MGSSMEEPTSAPGSMVTKSSCVLLCPCSTAALQHQTLFSDSAVTRTRNLICCNPAVPQHVPVIAGGSWCSTPTDSCALPDKRTTSDKRRTPKVMLRRKK